MFRLHVQKHFQVILLERTNSMTTQQVVVIAAIAVAALLIFLVTKSLRNGPHRQQRGEASATPPQQQQQQAAPKTGVQTAGDSNFEQLVGGWPGMTVVFFYAPWCHFCKSAKPKFEQLASAVDPSKVQLLQVNCDEHKSLGAKYAGSFPTMVRFRGSTQPAGKLVGERSLDEMMAFTQT
jgi:thiol-disulfide isomerase/thioredoxin